MVKLLFEEGLTYYAKNKSHSYQDVIDFINDYNSLRIGVFGPTFFFNPALSYIRYDILKSHNVLYNEKFNDSEYSGAELTGFLNELDSYSIWTWNYEENKSKLVEKLLNHAYDERVVLTQDDISWYDCVPWINWPAAVLDAHKDEIHSYKDMLLSDELPVAFELVGLSDGNEAESL